MSRIEIENKKPIRESLKVNCGYTESKEFCLAVPAENNCYDYLDLAKVDKNLNRQALMDLSGDGFLNDGNCFPLGSALPDNKKYGFISKNVTSEKDGNLSIRFEIESKIPSKELTFILSDKEDNIKTVTADKPDWKEEVRLPEEYQEVEFVQSTGTQYIDTDFSIGEHAEAYADVYVEFHILSKSASEQDIIGTYTNGIGGFACGLRNDEPLISNDDVLGRWDYGGANGPFGKIGAYGLIGPTPLNYTIYMFAQNQNGKVAWIEGKKRIYSFFIEKPKDIEHPESSVTEYHLYMVPCYRKSDGEIGFYDIARKRFFTNSGSGKFIKGADVHNTYKASVSLDVKKFNPSEHIYILNVIPGQAWSFDNNNLISCNLNLRGVDTSINPELQISEIDIQAYFPEDITNKLESFLENSPIWYSAGYPGEMSQMRHFYLSEPLKKENNIVTIKGQDSTGLIDGQYEGRLENASEGMLSTYVNAIQEMTNHFKREPDVSNPYENGYGHSEQLFLDNKSKRKQIAQAVNLFRNDFFFEYVDAGIPTFRYKRSSLMYEIYDSQIFDFKKNVELKIGKITVPIYSGTKGSNEEEIGTQDSEVLSSFFFSSSDPVYEWRSSPGWAMYEKANDLGFEPLYTMQFMAFSDKETIYGKKVDVKEIQYSVGDGNGVNAELDSIPSITMNGRNYSKEAIRDLLKRANVTYEFTYRGNPIIQPRDYIRLYITDEDPLIMTIESITHEHDVNGYKSQIVARKGML